MTFNQLMIRTLAVIALISVPSVAFAVGDRNPGSAVCLGSLHGVIARATEPPNIILIMADDAGYGQVGAYSDFADANVQTPAIDSLVKTGMLFTEAYASASMCWPTRGALLTGKWSARWNNHSEVPGSYKRLGQMMQEAGYYTMMIGKTHNGIGDGDVPPTNWGWDRYFATFTQHDYFTTYCAPGMGKQQFTNAVGYGSGMNNNGLSNRVEPVEVDPKTGQYTQQGWLTRNGWGSVQEWREDVKEGFLTIPYEWALRYAPVLESDQEGGFEYVTDLGSYTIHDQFQDRDIQAGYLPEAFNKKGVQFVKEHLQQHRDQPFLLYMPRSVVHVPNHKPPTELIAPERRHLLKAQDGSTDRALLMDILDRGVSDLVDLLKAEGVFENTLIIFCSDNGGNEESMGIYRGRKGQLFEGGIRTPFVMSWPDGLPDDKLGSQCDLPLTLTDLAPTFLAAAGAEIPEDLDTVNLLPYWQGQTSRRPPRFGDAMYWGSGSTGSYAVRHDVLDSDGHVKHSWKLVRQGGKEYLFDLASDPSEETPLENPQVRTQMRKLVNAWFVEMGKDRLLKIDSPVGR